MRGTANELGSNGSCIVMAFRDTDTACNVTGTDGCSGVFCNGQGVCNLTKNATDGAKCLVPDDYTTRYLADCRESSCKQGVCTLTRYYNSSRICEHDNAGYSCATTFCKEGVCTEFFNNRTICTPPPTPVYYDQNYYYVPTYNDPCLPY
eukprot:SM002182S06710  [mRNA]  locus=s2182:64:1813:+ [translate_table: standard]